MIFFDKRKQRKFLADLKSRRHAEDDLLSPALRSRFDEVIAKLEQAQGKDIAGAIKTAEAEYNALPLPRRGWQYVVLDLIFVVGAIAFALRGLYFQPFRIPTGSMQPTLFGIHYQSEKDNANPGFKVLPGVLHQIVYGTAPAKAEVKNPGAFQGFTHLEPGTVFDRMRFQIGSDEYSLPGTDRQVYDYAGLARGSFDAGDKLGGGDITIGDHLFVERFSIYLKAPSRGDVIVFNTENLSVDNIALSDAGGYYYIKRVAALPGDTVKIEKNQLWVRPRGKREFRRIQDIEPRFRKIYSHRGGYHGHLSCNEMETGAQAGMRDFSRGKEFTVPEDEYLMLGDNSRFSMDSRYFGTVPRRNLIGRAWIVFYPFSRRVGTVDRQMPLDEPTGTPGVATFPVMSKQ
ncbi:MAG: signal peptidase I [Lentisphaeria bacterium]|nr:signal peptidase I [Lentisphaeria bacterium]